MNIILLTASLAREFVNGVVLKNQLLTTKIKDKPPNGTIFF